MVVGGYKVAFVAFVAGGDGICNKDFISST